MKMLKRLANVEPFWFVIAALAAWRATAIINYEGIALPLREKVGIDPDKEPLEQPNFPAKAMSCFWCCSVWISGFITLTLGNARALLLPFAISGLAIHLQRLCDVMHKDIQLKERNLEILNKR